MTVERAQVESELKTIQELRNMTKKFLNIDPQFMKNNVDHAETKLAEKLTEAILEGLKEKE